MRLRYLEQRLHGTGATIIGTGHTAITAGIMTPGITGIPGIMTGTDLSAIITAGIMTLGIMTPGTTALIIMVTMDTTMAVTAGMTTTGTEEAAVPRALQGRRGSDTVTRTLQPAEA